jgi:hydroxyethylthiazole kinase
MAFVANGLLALGASPIMSVSEDEIDDLLHLSQALVINLGTLDKAFLNLAKTACEQANKQNTPIILDPVGAGASTYRTTSAWQLMDTYRIALIRGNASEIMALAGEAIQTKGVDSTAESTDAITATTHLSKQTEAVVCVSGKTDIIASNNDVTRIEGGSSMMPHVTGTGCLLSAVTAAFCAVRPDVLPTAAETAARFYGQCGEIAEKKATGPGSFSMHFLDALRTCS